MAEPVARPLLKGCGLPQAWAGFSAWRILETRFDRGLHFLSTWHAWKNDPHRPAMLHYVALTSTPPGLDDLRASAATLPALQPLLDELASQWFGLLPGFHRLTLDDGRVLLTLCVGDITSLLRAQAFVADSVYLDPGQDHASTWDIWSVKALARCCRRGTGISTPQGNARLLADLTQCGFEWTTSLATPPRISHSGHFNPRWEIKKTRDPLSGETTAPGTCAVIGAGLAGASVAAALAKRGWQVTVLERGESPAAGASGLPVGLVVPHVSIDDCALSSLSRSGVRLMLQQAASLLIEGQDWAPTGTLERRLDGSAGLPLTWPAAGLEWSEPATAQALAQVWHHHAAWLKPAQLVRAWLALPGITFQAHAEVAKVCRTGDDWALLDAQGLALTRAQRVVFANAKGVIPLIDDLQTNHPTLGVSLKQLPHLHGVRGQLSWALHKGPPNAAFPAFPMNGSGSVAPLVPTPDGLAWFAGSSYEPDSQPPAAIERNHAGNLERLSLLVPHLGKALAQQFADGEVNTWQNTRCVTADRLPAVGPLYKSDNPSLWMCAGMGSRGLSFSVLCAELLAARWAGEPLAVDASLAQALNALRGAR